MVHIYTSLAIIHSLYGYYTKLYYMIKFYQRHIIIMSTGYKLEQKKKIVSGSELPRLNICQNESCYKKFRNF